MRKGGGGGGVASWGGIFRVEEMARCGAVVRSANPEVEEIVGVGVGGWNICIKGRGCIARYWVYDKCKLRS